MLQLPSCFVVVTLVILCIAPGNDSTSPEVSEPNNDSRARFVKLLTSIANINKKRLNYLKKYAHLEDYSIPSGIMRTDDNPKTDEAAMGIVLVNDNNTAASSNLISKKINTRTNKVKKTPVKNIMKFIKDNYDDYIDNNEEDEDDLRILQQFQNESLVEKHKENVLATDKNYKKVINIGTDTRMNEKQELNESDSKGSKQLLRWRYSCGRHARRQCKKACKASLRKVCDEYQCGRKMRKSFKRACRRYCYRAFY